MSNLTVPAARFLRTTTSATRAASAGVTTRRVLFFVVVLAAWEILARAGIANENFTSKPTALVVAGVRMLGDAEVHEALGVTLVAIVLSFVIGTGLGVVFGVVLGLQQLLRRAYFPIVMMLLGTPKSLFLPIIMLFFGLGMESAVFFASLLTFVHVTVNVVAGVDLVEPRHLQVARAFRASKLQRFVHVILPGASPGLFTAVWHGLRNAFVGVVIAQLFTSTAGLGYLVRVYSNNLQTDYALALVLMASIVVIAVGTGWNRVERRLTRWRVQETT
jgi:ABC-type nitrate/sulfonate/bicarbonate transport system permease component